MEKRHSCLTYLHRMLCILLVLLVSTTSQNNLLVLQAAQVRYVSYLSAGMIQSTGKIDFKYCQTAQALSDIFEEQSRLYQWRHLSSRGNCSGKISG